MRYTKEITNKNTICVTYYTEKSILPSQSKNFLKEFFLEKLNLYFIGKAYSDLVKQTHVNDGKSLVINMLKSCSGVLITLEIYYWDDINKHMEETNYGIRWPIELEFPAEIETFNSNFNETNLKEIANGALKQIFKIYKSHFLNASFTLDKIKIHLTFYLKE
jgi:hypothetical protein